MENKKTFQIDSKLIQCTKCKKDKHILDANFCTRCGSKLPLHS